MVFSDEYIKMVLALPDEFFENWDYSDGDAILVNENGNWKLGYLGNVVLSCLCIDLCPIILSEPEYGYKLEGEVKPLPSQEQLQKLVDPDWKEAYDILYKWTYLHPIKTEGSKELWLIMLMDIKYNMKWDREKWV